MSIQSLCFSAANPQHVPRNPQSGCSNLSPKLISMVPPPSTFSVAGSCLPDLSAQVKEKILCLEIMGINSSKALTINPSLEVTTLDSINTVVSYLQSKGLHYKDLGRILGMCPTILTSDVRRDLAPVFRFLREELGVRESNYRRIIKKCPRLLISSVPDQLKPTLTYLRRIGFDNDETLACQDPILLVSSVENTLMPKLDHLQSEIGLSRDESLEMVLRCPALFTFSIENNLKPKLGFFVDVMNGDLKEIREFPQYFGFSLEKRIKPRYSILVENHVTSIVPLSFMLKTTDLEFRQLIIDKTARRRRS
ncbi:Mitochondrial transcription termination factor family [Zostera marina]|uniref:Mitochondrial transcription termination factor family n=1 Tax=Zostera marina TaxID=29655 RepID=A0A0K9PF96_ZOSMR|nr:Mitochondrial transcription termination factor family [Zostera marina]